MATLGIHPHTIIKYFQCPATGVPGLLLIHLLAFASILLRLSMQPKLAPKQKRSYLHLLAPAPVVINLHLAIA